MDVEEVRTRFVMFCKAETVSDLGVSFGGASFMLNAWRSRMTRRNVSTTLRQPVFEFKLGFSAFGLAG